MDEALQQEIRQWMRDHVDDFLEEVEDDYGAITGMRVCPTRLAENVRESVLPPGEDVPDECYTIAEEVVEEFNAKCQRSLEEAYLECEPRTIIGQTQCAD